jgi:putative flippase GtrA
LPRSATLAAVSALLANRATLVQGGRYVFTGAVVALLYMAITTVMRAGLGLPWAAAVAIGYSVSTTTHFTLQRYFVFRSNEGFALSFHQQATRYYAVVVFQYLLTVGAMAVLPRLLGLPEFVVYPGVVCSITPMTFLLLRKRLFHAG